MSSSSNGLTAELEQALGELLELRRFPGPPREFWPRLLACSARLTGADHFALLLKDAGPPPAWKKMAEWSSNRGPSRFRAGFSMQLEDLASQCAANSSLLHTLEQNNGTGHFALAVRLKLGRPEDEAVLLGLLEGASSAQAREALLRLGMAADTPQVYQLGQAARQARGDVEKLATVLDLLVPVNESRHFLAGALAFCNGLVTRLGCERASLGWLEGGYIRLCAMSRTEKFDRNMAAAQSLEAAMEECLDQDEEIVWPVPAGATTVARDHERFASDQKIGHLCSLPLRFDGKPVAVLTCERQAGPFTSTELQQLRLGCDQVVGRLADLKEHNRWFGARWASTAREQAGRLFGPEHTAAKLLGLAIVALLAALFLVRVNYRVEGTFILRSDEVSYSSAPFDGYIQEVFVRTGDPVEKGGRLLTLNTSELSLEKAAALADLSRYERETDKARAASALAEMRIAQAMVEQTRARLDVVKYRLDNAVIKSPVAGAVIEGDLRERIGAPVKQGDVLFRVARLDTLYAQAEINERDIHEILGKEKGEIAFVTEPKLKYPVRLMRVEPAAVPKKDGNVFLVRLSFDQPLQPWWRPGMSGLCKLYVEKRTLFWILTHRTVDFLRMKLWW